MRAAWLIAIFGLVSTVAYAAPPMDTDETYTQSCAKLVDTQWRQHANRSLYSSTHVLFVSRSKRIQNSYCIGVAFLRAENQYDLTLLQCKVHPDRSAEIADDTCSLPPGAPLMGMWNELNDMAHKALSGDNRNGHWVSPYTDTVPAAITAAKDADKIAIQNHMTRQSITQGQRETGCMRQATDALHAAAQRDPRSLVDSGVDPNTFIQRVYQSCMTR
jgi:hypothetical protein